MGHENDSEHRRKTGSEQSDSWRSESSQNEKGKRESGQDDRRRRGSGQQKRERCKISKQNEKGRGTSRQDDRRRRGSVQHDRGRSKSSQQDKRRSSSKKNFDDRRREKDYYHDRERSSDGLQDDMLEGSPRYNKDDKGWSPIGQQDDRGMDEVGRRRKMDRKRKREQKLSSRDSSNEYKHIEDRDPYDLEVHWDEQLPDDDENSKILNTNENHKNFIKKAKMSQSKNLDPHKNSIHFVRVKDDLRQKISLLKKRRPNAGPCKNTKKRKLDHDKVTVDDGKEKSFKYKTRYEQIKELQQLNALLKSEKDEAKKTVELMKDEKVKLNDHIQEQKYRREISDSKVTSLETNVEANNVKIIDLEKQLDDAKEDHNNQIAKVAQLENKNSRLEKQLNDEKEGHKKQIAKVAQLRNENSRLTSNEKCYGNEGSYLDKDKLKALDLEVEVTTLKKKLEELHAKISDLTKNNCDLLSSNKEHTERNGELLLENSQLLSDIKDVKSKNVDLVKENKRLAISQGVFIANNSELKAENEKLSVNNIVLIAKNNEQTKQNTELVAKNNNLRTNNIYLFDKNSDLTNKINNLASEIKDLKRKLDESDTNSILQEYEQGLKIIELEKQIQAGQHSSIPDQDSIHILQKQLKNEKAKNDGIENNLKKTKEANKNLEDKLENMLKEFVDLEKVLDDVKDKAKADLSEANTAKEILRAEIKGVKNQLEDLRSAQKETNQEEKDNIESLLHKKTKRISDLEEEKVQNNEVIKILTTNLIELQADLQQKTEELEDLNAADNKEDLDQTNSKIQINKEESERKLKLAESKQKKAEMALKKSEDNLNESDNLYSSLITKLEAEVKRLKAEVERLEAEIKRSQ